MSSSSSSSSSHAQTDALSPSAQSPYAYVDGFDPNSTNDPVFIHLFEHITEWARTENTAQIIQIHLQKLWRIRVMKSQNINNIDALSDVLAALCVAENTESLLDDLAALVLYSSPVNVFHKNPSLTQAERDVKACIHRAAEYKALDRNAGKKAWTATELFIKSHNYTLPEVCRKRRFDDLLGGAYAAASDSYWKWNTAKLRKWEPFDGAKYMKVYVVTYLHLCGGHPVFAAPTLLRRDATIDELRKEVADFQVSHQQSSTPRLGGLTKKMLDHDTLEWQIAPKLADLKDRWAPITDGFQTTRTDDRIFIILLCQRTMPASIQNKVLEIEKKRAEADEAKRSKSKNWNKWNDWDKWNNWEDVKCQNDQARLLPPPEYVPAPVTPITIATLHGGKRDADNIRMNDKKLKHRARHVQQKRNLAIRQKKEWELAADGNGSA